MSQDSTSQTPQYDVEIPSREAMLEVITKAIKPVPYQDIISHFKLNDERQQIGVKRRLRAMERDGQLVYTRNDAYGLPDRMDLKKGVVIGHRDGFGFVQLDEGGQDLYLPYHQMQLVMHGDRVLVKAGSADAKGRREARVVRSLSDEKREIVGRYFFEQGLSLVVPDDTRQGQDLIIPPEHVNGARHGQMVVAEVLARPSRRSSPLARIKEILGDHLAPGMEIEVAIREHGIPHEWPDNLKREADKIPDEVLESDKHGRVDLRKLPLVTIDGEDARDFDDAVYCQPDGKGFRLWVAIADVSHYVRPGTALDREAHGRGNSVYFPQQVIPMLPEKLSNGLCSLNPQVDRLCMVAEMVIGARGKLMEYSFYPAVMNSHARLTYTKVAAILEGDPALRKEYDAVVPHLESLQQLYKVLRQARDRRGAIDFDTVETRFIFNAQRKIERIVPVYRNQAHMLIEECMIMANVAAAQFVEKHNGGALFRVHDLPDEDRLMAFRMVLGELGLTMPIQGDPTPEDFAKVLEQVADRPDRELIQTMLLRSLQQAVYSAENRGHFGLSLAAYAHFTSPIRRYPDLILHREIKRILSETLPGMPGLEGKHVYDESALGELGPHCSHTERRADDATRQVDEFLKCEFMQDHVGDEFEGVISSVTNFGLFIRLNDLMIDGLVHISNMTQEYYHYDADRHLLVGESSGKVYRIGDKATVKVASVSLAERKIDFELLAVEHSSAALPPRKRVDLKRSRGKGSERGKGTSRGGKPSGKGSGPSRGKRSDGKGNKNAKKHSGKKSGKGPAKQKKRRS
ncbi:ribonuclease R [Aliidiomarina sanyensis]|uniref:Ribonuclease R n=1 Tax=Aliidiomarina sanyensis TaxID=1249555 RepID=A0A432WB75_9GAMM|nr:ribonuclease R [Aliidiomarina sanyensis]RUO28225.1 ribonuclease R [Aliidiomarina sanyensis]